MITELTTDTFDAFINEHKIVVVDFYATWCSPCMQIMKILPRLDEIINEIAQIGKVDIDACPELKARFEIKSVPTFLFFLNGHREYQFAGVLRLMEIEGYVKSLNKN